MKEESSPNKKAIQNMLFEEKQIYKFLNNLELKENGCIEYIGNIDSQGYGRIRIGSKENNIRIGAHRWALQFVAGGVILPPEIFVCHKCDNPACVAPDHLFPGTRQDNIDDMVAKDRSAISFGNSKLDWDIIDDIRTSKLNGVELAEKYNVAKSTISEIRNHLIWKEEHRHIAHISK